MPSQNSFTFFLFMEMVHFLHSIKDFLSVGSIFFFFLIFFPTVFFLLLTGKQLKSTSSYHHIYWLITSFIHSSLFRFRLFFILLLFASYFLDLYEIADANQKPFFESSIAAKKSSQANVSECNIHKNNNKWISMKKLALRYQRLI